MTSFDTYLENELTDPEFKKEWDKLQPEMDSIGASLHEKADQDPH